MNRYRIVVLIAFLLVSDQTNATEATTKKPNVLFVLADDLRTDLGCYGSVARTPHIDQLAKRGLRFDRAYCQQALCNPSRSSFLTGRRPDSLHLWNNSMHFREKNPDVATLPGWFKQHGYVTRNVGKIFHNWHTKQKGDRDSWSADEFLHYEMHGNDKPLTNGEIPANLTTTINCFRHDVPDSAYFDGRVADEALRVLAEIKDKPFFLALGFWKPHAPFNAPKKYWDLYDPKHLLPFDASRPKDAPEWAFHDSRELRGIPPKQVTFRQAEAMEMRHGYLANISYMDAQLGKVIAALEKHQLTNNTIIVFLADHGYHLGEHSLWAKTSCFELDAHVPLIIVDPQNRTLAGKQTSALVELIDLFPTMAELCGLPFPKSLEGRSLLPVLKDPGNKDKTFALTQHPRPAYFDRTEKGIPDAMGYSIRTAKVRYTEWRDWTTGKVLARELYDHVHDPNETKNQIDVPALEAEWKQAKDLLHQQVSPDIPPCKR